MRSLNCRRGLSFQEEFSNLLHYIEAYSSSKVCGWNHISHLFVYHPSEQIRQRFSIPVGKQCDLPAIF